MWLLAVASVASAWADDGDRARARLERQRQRHGQTLTERVEQFGAACKLVSLDPTDPRATKRVVRAESALITARAREVGCTSRLDAWELPERTVDVLYATNRDHGETEEGDWFYAPRDTDRIEYGVARVAIPARHPAGALDRSLVVVEITPLSEEAFGAALVSALDTAGDGAEILAYVHGYNNSFEYSTRRLAQITNDLHRPVVPVLFSWPSSGGTWFASAKYTFDENAAARASAPFADVLAQLLATNDAPVTLFAHSMGSRVVSDALVDLERRGELVRPLADVVFAAPDIDVSVFARRYLETSLQASARLTVYCAADDRALSISRSVHGGYDRLGSCSDTAISLLDRNGVEIVDASKLWVNLMDHDKVASSPRLLADLRRLLDGVPAGDLSRGLVVEADRYVLPP